jgi:hypothetical protein
MARLILTGSVGAGGKKGETSHNAPADVQAVRDRLVALGFDWMGPVARGDEKPFIETVRLFQCICKGSGKLDSGDGRVDLHKNTHRWLAATNAPEWKKIYNKKGPGWHNTGDFRESNGGYCTSWLLKAITDAGQFYYDKYMKANPDYPPFWIRECSPEDGGDAAGHASHETGLDVDMRLPLKAPDTKKWDFLGKDGYKDKRYYQEAAKAQLKSIKEKMNTYITLFNDPDLMKLGLCRFWKNHQHHYHIRLRPPARIDGIYK